MPEDLKKGVWIGNLEGTLLESSACEKQTNGVFNNVEAIQEVLETLHFKAFVLANNHLLDAGDYAVSAQNLNHIDVQGVGAGSNIEEASQYVDVTDTDGTIYRILAFGWDCIECQYAGTGRQGVNPYKKKHIFDLVKAALDTNVRLICFFHWNYELE
nr:CapA family protein [Lachnospiraceae bacterium]